MDVLLIGARLWLWAAMLRGLKQVVPIATLVRIARVSPRRHPTAGLRQRVESYLERKGRFPFRPPSNCLERSLGAYRLLCRGGAKPELVVGVRHSPERGVEGHVWVTIEGHVLGETDADIAGFTPIVIFDSQGRQTSSASTSNLQLPTSKFNCQRPTE